MLLRPLAPLRLTISAAFVIACAGAPRAEIQAPDAISDAAAFVLTLGTDTISAESYTRTGTRVDGVIVRRIPRTVVVRYTMTLAPNGLASRLEYNTRLPDGNRLPTFARSIIVTFSADSAITEIIRDSVVTRRVAARDAYPELEGGVFFFALPIAALRAANRDSAHFTLYTPGATQASGSPAARREGGNRWWVYSFDSPFEIVTDDAGRILSLDGSRTTSRFQARRLPPMDLSAMAMAFFERERATGPIVALSPRDSVSATVGGAQVSIGYGRPSARGRRIWGPNGVLGDTLWRTGANASTKFTSSAPLTIGGHVLPAGTYSVMTLAVPGRYQLLFFTGNTDVLRVPLSARPLHPPVELFTIAVEPTAERAGVLRLQWDTQELSAPFAVTP